MVARLQRFEKWWSLPAAPAPICAEVLSIVLMAVPAVLGAVLDWNFWITIALLIPGVLVSIRAQRVAARTRGLRVRTDVPPNIRGAEIASVMAAVLAGSFLPPRFYCVVLVGFIGLGSVVTRALWRGAGDHAS